MTTNITQSTRFFSTKDGLIDKVTLEWLKENQVKELPTDRVEIISFRSLFKDFNKNVSYYYNDLTLSQIWDFLSFLLEIHTGIRQFQISTNVEAMMIEWNHVKKIFISTLFTENMLLELKGFDYTMTNMVQMSVNHLFRTKVCYIFKIIEANPFTELIIKKADVKRSKPEDLDAIFQAIRDSCMGDTDEMVMYCMDFIKTKWMTTNHLKLATVCRKAYDPKMVIENDLLDTSESWRQLFPTFFDEPGKSLKTFFNAFTNYCILFFMEDYLQLRTDQLQIIPFTQPYYYVRGPDGTIAADVLFFYGIQSFNERIKQIKEIHKNSL